ncbi:MAG: type II toxin-antitoxin system PemK/MazF family toxin [Clostridium sp.]|nr:type II toxin-antitoxin system PemK/MazF family toxin [Clostridium sp.]
MTEEEKEQRRIYTMSLSQYSRELFWLDKKLYLSSLKDSVVRRKVKRNEVYRCNFGVGVGSEMDKDRPAVIIQVNSFNSTSGNTIVAPITHDKGNISCLIPIKNRYDENGELILDGKINVSNLMCVSKARLGNKVGELDTDEIKNLNNALYYHLSLDMYVKQLENTIKQKDKYISELKEKRKIDNEFLNNLKRISQKYNKEDILKYLKYFEKLIDNSELQ